MDTRYNLNRLAYFVATIEEGTITAAAARLGISKAVVSKQLQLLEEEIGVSLLSRNTRSIQPTEAGEVFYQSSKVALTQAHAAFEAVQERGNVPSGKLRITAPVDLGVTHIAPLATRFCVENPRVEIELVLSDEQQDLVENRFDMSFRVGWLRDSTNRAKKLASFKEIVVCAPELLRQHSIEKPEDLTALPFVSNSALSGNRWKFHQGESVAEIEFQQVISMNVTLGILAAVKAGLCFAIMPDFLLTQDLAAKRLTRLLPDWSLREGGVYALSPPSRLRSSAARAFLELVGTEIK